MKLVSSAPTVTAKSDSTATVSLSSVVNSSSSSSSKAETARRDLWTQYSHADQENDKTNTTDQSKGKAISFS